MNHKKIDFKEISFNPFANPIEDSNDPDSHYFDETYYDTKYFHVSEINTLFNGLAQHENFIEVLRLDNFSIALKMIRKRSYSFN